MLAQRSTRPFKRRSLALRYGYHGLETRNALKDGPLALSPNRKHEPGSPMDIANIRRQGVQ